MFDNITNMYKLYKIPDYDYYINEYGDVFNKRMNKLKPYMNKNYLRIGLSKNNKRKHYYIHQLVAIVFLNHIPNNHESNIDHIDSDKLNNHVSNLRIVSHRFNSGKERKGVTGIKGVFYNKERHRYYSRICIKDDYFWLVTTTDIDYCKKFYDKAVELSHLYSNDRKSFRDLIKKEVNN